MNKNIPDFAKAYYRMVIFVNDCREGLTRIRNKLIIPTVYLSRSEYNIIMSDPVVAYRLKGYRIFVCEDGSDEYVEVCEMYDGVIRGTRTIDSTYDLEMIAAGDYIIDMSKLAIQPLDIKETYVREVKDGKVVV